MNFRVDNRSNETQRERQNWIQLFETKHEMSIEAILKDLSAAYRALPEEQQSDPEPDLTWLYAWNWKWKNEDKLKQRFFDRLGLLGTKVSI